MTITSLNGLTPVLDQKSSPGVNRIIYPSSSDKTSSVNGNTHHTVTDSHVGLDQETRFIYLTVWSWTFPYARTISNQSTVVDRTFPLILSSLHPLKVSMEISLFYTTGEKVKGNRLYTYVITPGLVGREDPELYFRSTTSTVSSYHFPRNQEPPTPRKSGYEGWT